MVEQNIYINKRELLWAKQDEYRHLSEEAERKAEEAAKDGDIEGWRMHMLIALEYLDKCYAITKEIQDLAQGKGET